MGWGEASTREAGRGAGEAPPVHRTDPSITTFSLAPTHNESDPLNGGQTHAWRPPEYSVSLPSMKNLMVGYPCTPYFWARSLCTVASTYGAGRARAAHRGGFSTRGGGLPGAQRQTRESSASDLMLAAARGPSPRLTLPTVSSSSNSLMAVAALAHSGLSDCASARRENGHRVLAVCDRPRQLAALGRPKAAAMAADGPRIAAAQR